METRKKKEEAININDRNNLVFRQNVESEENVKIMMS